MTLTIAQFVKNGRNRHRIVTGVTGIVTGGRRVRAIIRHVRHKYSGEEETCYVVFVGSLRRNEVVTQSEAGESRYYSGLSQ